MLVSEGLIPEIECSEKSHAVDHCNPKRSAVIQLHFNWKGLQCIYIINSEVWPSVRLSVCPNRTMTVRPIFWPTSQGPISNLSTFLESLCHLGPNKIICLFDLNKQRKIHSYKNVDERTNKLTCGRTDKQTDMWTNGQTDMWTNGQTNRIYSLFVRLSIRMWTNLK